MTTNGQSKILVCPRLLSTTGSPCKLRQFYRDKMGKGGSKLLAIEPNFDLSRLNEIPEDIREAIERHISSQTDQFDELKSNYERLRVDSGERRLKSERRNYFANCTLSYEIYLMIFRYASKHNGTLKHNESLCHVFVSRETSAFEVGSSHMLWAIIERRGSVVVVSTSAWHLLLLLLPFSVQGSVFRRIDALLVAMTAKWRIAISYLSPC